MKILLSPVLIAALALTVFACAKKEESKSSEPPAQPSAATAPEQDKAPAPVPGTKVEEPDADTSADYLRVVSMHNDPNPNDPVVISITKFTVTTKDFDPKNIEGASAEIVLDLSSIDSGSSKRDGHLKSPDFLGVDISPRAVVKVSNVKKVGDAFKASADVTAHGASKSMSIDFKVVSTEENAVQIEATKEFSRADFGIGEGHEDNIADMVTIEMRLTFKKN